MKPARPLHCDLRAGVFTANAILLTHRGVVGVFADTAELMNGYGGQAFLPSLTDPYPHLSKAWH